MSEYESPSDVIERENIKSEEFSELIQKIDYASKEVKKLWREIYENAIQDRLNASLLFLDLYKSVANSADGHNIYGKQITLYLEKMNKANDQLLKLSELVCAASTVDTDIDAEALYNEIDKK